MIFMYINDFFIEVANVQLFYKVTYKIKFTRAKVLLIGSNLLKNKKVEQFFAILVYALMGCILNIKSIVQINLFF